jgi:hypothetical protein
MGVKEGRSQKYQQKEGVAQRRTHCMRVIILPCSEPLLMLSWHICSAKRSSKSHRPEVYMLWSVFLLVKAHASGRAITCEQVPCAHLELVLALLQSCALRLRKHSSAIGGASADGTVVEVDHVTAVQCGRAFGELGDTALFEGADARYFLCVHPQVRSRRLSI